MYDLKLINRLRSKKKDSIRTGEFYRLCILYHPPYVNYYWNKDPDFKDYNIRIDIIKQRFDDLWSDPGLTKEDFLKHAYFMELFDQNFSLSSRYIPEGYMSTSCRLGSGFQGQP